MAHRLHPRQVLWLSLALAVLMLVGRPLLGAAQAPPADLPATARVLAGDGDLAPATDELLVKFVPGTAQVAAREAAGQAGLASGDWIAQQAVLVVRSTDGASAAAEMAALAARPDVVYVEANPVVTGQDIPDDPEYAPNQWAPPKIGMPAAWDVTTGSSDVLAGVLDTGLDMTHSEFSGKYAAGYDFVNADSDPSDDHGHGTHVAGVVGALTDNGVGIAAVGRDTTVLPVKVLNASGLGTHAIVAQGIDWATDQGAQIINLSLGGPAGSQTLHDAVDYAYDHGVLVVAAAGNGNTSTPYYPAAYPNVMAIAATTSTDGRWALSNYGSWISMAAPGASIRSTDWTGGAGPYATRTGTSQAAAHVSAVAALMLAVNPSQTNAELRQELEASAYDLGAPGRDDYFGWGRVDGLAAVNAALPATPTPAATATATATPVPTATPLPPVITNVFASGITRTNATINWTTDVPATSQVEYGKTMSYGSLTALDSTLVTSHAVGLSGLQRNTTYYYRVRSKNASGVEAVSGNHTFKTSK